MQHRFRHWKLGLLLSDLVGLVASFHLGFYLRQGAFYKSLYIPGSFWYVFGVLIVFYVLDLYNPWSQYSTLGLHFRSLAGSFVAGAVTSIAVYLTSDFTGHVQFGRGVVFLSFAVFTPFAFLVRWYVHRRLHPARLDIRILVLTSPATARYFQKEIQRRGSLWHVSYLFDSEAKGKATKMDSGPNVRLLHGGIGRHLSAELKKGWTAVVIGTDRLTPEQSEKILDARMGGQAVYDLSDFYERYFFKIPVYYLEHSWFVLNRGFLILENLTSRRIKTAMDKILALLFLIPGLPLMGFAAILVLLESGRPVLFRQERTGLKNQSFFLMKIRTMVQDAERDGARWAAKNDARVTRIGRFLRVTRLDELPQLFNILRGEMSFIGPRPERPIFNEMLEREIPFYALRHIIQPGLTGWAQVMYPYGASIEDSWQKLEYDLFYIKNYTPVLDLSILIKTVRVVLFGSGR